MRKEFLFSGLVLCLSASIYAQDSRKSQPPVKSQQSAASSASQPAKIDPAKEADIRRLLDLVGTRALVKQTMEAMSDSIKPALTSSLPPGEYRAQLVDLFFATFLSRADPQHLLNIAVPIYDKNFSHDEIKGMIRFYESPVGQKAAAVLPQMTLELQQAGRKWGEDLGRQTMEDVLAEHPDLAAALQAASKDRQ